MEVPFLPVHRILVVDDETGIVNAVRRELMTPPFGAHRYEVETFTNPRVALVRAAEEEFEAAVSDYHMPEMTGFEFLIELRKIQPDCMRVVLSGQTDMDALVRLVNETHIYRFLPKPWSSYFLKSTLSQAVKLRQSTVENRRLANILRQHGIDQPVEVVNDVAHVLVVDDNLSAANAIARALTRHSLFDDVFRVVREEAYGHAPLSDSSRISVQVTDSPAHGLKMADNIPFACVIADYRMPLMDGGQFLMAFAEKQPDCACIMLSGEANMEALVIALDLAHIYAFVSKPWVDHELRTIVAQAMMERYLRLENEKLAQVCKKHHLEAGE